MKRLESFFSKVYSIGYPITFIPVSFFGEVEKF